MTLTAKGLTPITRTELQESLFSATTITIGADTDANGSGTIDFQTRGVTRAQFNNLGTLVFPAGTSRPLIQQIQSTQSTYGHFNVNYFPFSNGADPQLNHVVGFGWNMAHGGGPLVAGKGAFYEQFESHYRPGGVGDPREWFEWHLNFFGYAGATPASSRPISIASDKPSGDSIIALQGYFIIANQTGAINYMQGDDQGFTFQMDQVQFRDSATNNLQVQIDPTEFFVGPPIRSSNALTVYDGINGRVLKFEASPTSGEGVIFFGLDSTVNSVSIESGSAAPTHTTRTHGSVYLQRNGKAYVYNGSVWLGIPSDGAFSIDVLILDTTKQLKFANGWPPDVGMGRVAGPRMRITDASTGFGSLEVGTLYMNDGTVKQVTYGANDSGGTGFKVLRIAN